MPLTSADKQQLLTDIASLTTKIQALTPDVVAPPPPPPPPVVVIDTPVIFDGKLGGLSYDGPWGPYDAEPTWQQWKNTGGDWLDKNGAPQGSIPFASMSMLYNATGVVTLNVTSFVVPGVEAQVALVGYGNLLTVFKSREAGSPARLIVDYTDGSRAFIPVMYDVSSDPSSLYSVGDRTSFTVGGKYVGYLRFPATLNKPILAATLELTVEKCWGPGTLSVYRFAVHTDTPDPYYPTFNNPFFSTEAFEPGSIPAYLNDRIWRTDVAKQLTVVNTPNGKVLECRWDPAQNGLTNANILMPDGNGKYGREATRVIFAYDTTVLPDFLSSLTEGGKFAFGFCSATKSDDIFDAATFGYYPGSCGTPLVGGGAAANGTNGWSLRGLFHKDPPAPHPHNGRLRTGVYAYHARMLGWNNPNGGNGDNWHWSQYGGGLLVPGQRHRITWDLTVNTPGVFDGVLRCWVDGRLVLFRNNIMLRDVGPYVLNSQGVNTQLLIRSVYFNFYHGGHALPVGFGGAQVSNFVAQILS